MTLWDTPAQAGPGRFAEALEGLTAEELKAKVKQAVEDSREEVERRTKPYREGWQRSREMCRPFWRTR